ncbi:MAG: OmpA family protein [Burkholderiaceae bacterium]
MSSAAGQVGAPAEQLTATVTGSVEKLAAAAQSVDAATGKLDASVTGSVDKLSAATQAVDGVADKAKSSAGALEASSNAAGKAGEIAKQAADQLTEAATTAKAAAGTLNAASSAVGDSAKAATAAAAAATGASNSLQQAADKAKASQAAVSEAVSTPRPLAAMPAPAAPAPATPAPATDAPAPATPAPSAAAPTSLRIDQVSMAAGADVPAQQSAYFRTSSATVLDRVTNDVADLVAWAKDSPRNRLGLAGFTDGTGNAEINAALSKARAEAVRDLLVSLGVSGDQIVMVEPQQFEAAPGLSWQARRVDILPLR